MKKCDYCEEEVATRRIPNPNETMDTVGNLIYWDVCKDCNQIIRAEEELRQGHITKNFSMVNSALEKLELIKKRLKEKKEYGKEHLT